MTQERLQIGQKFYYSGDMANNASEGEIIGINEPTKYTYLEYKVRYYMPRFKNDTMISNLNYLCFVNNNRFSLINEI
jgi:hypothetical protein